MDEWLANIWNPSMISTEFQELGKEKVLLYPVSPLGQMLHFMSPNPKSNSMIPT